MVIAFQSGEGVRSPYLQFSIKKSRISQSATDQEAVGHLREDIVMLFQKNLCGRICKAFRKQFHHDDAKNWDYDVIICGGSIVGATLAANLLKLSCGSIRVCVLEQKAPPNLQDCLNRTIPDARAYAFSPRSIRLLESVDAWNLISSKSQPYKSMQVWESMSQGLVRFHASDADSEELGRIAEESTVLSSIYESINRSNTLESFHFKISNGIRDISVEQFDDNTYGGVRVTTSTNEHFTARLLVGADGARSVVRQLSNIPTYGWSYAQDAVVATLKLEIDAESDYDGMTAYQRYLPSGPIAILPLWDGYCSLVWSLPSSEAKKILSLSDTDFTKTVNEVLQSASKKQSFNTAQIPILNRFNDVLSNIKFAIDSIVDSGLILDPKRSPPIVTQTISPRQSFPLNFQHTSKYYSPRVALVGDAAHSIHPQAGQGMNLGLADVISLSDSIINAAKVGEDFGSQKVLQNYQDSRYAANLAMMGVVDSINRIFSEKYKSTAPMEGIDDSNAWLRRYVRAIGMIGIHSFPSIKSKIVRFATGSYE